MSMSLSRGLWRGACAKGLTRHPNDKAGTTPSPPPKSKPKPLPISEIEAENEYAAEAGLGFVLGLVLGLDIGIGIGASASAQTLCIRLHLRSNAAASGSRASTIEVPYSARSGTSRVLKKSASRRSRGWCRNFSPQPPSQVRGLQIHSEAVSPLFLSLHPQFIEGGRGGEITATRLPSEATSTFSAPC